MEMQSKDSSSFFKKKEKSVTVGFFPIMATPIRSMKEVRIMSLISFLVCLPGLIGCSFDKNIFKQPERAVNKSEIPDREMENFSANSYDSNRKKWELKARKGRMYNRKKVSFLENVELHFYNENQKRSTYVVADFCKLHESTKDVELQSNVVIIASNRTRMIGDYFYWDNDKEILSSPQFVKVTREDGSVLTGVGLIADNMLDVITFKSDIRGYEEVKDGEQ